MKNLLAFTMLCLSSAVHAEHPQLRDVTKYADEVRGSYKKFMSVANSPDDEEVIKFGQYMRKLEERGKQFGTSNLDLPFGYCSVMGRSANNLWITLAMARVSSRDETFQIRGAEDVYKDAEKSCLAVIKEGGKPSNTPVCDEKDGCLTPTIIELN